MSLDFEVAQPIRPVGLSRRQRRGVPRGTTVIRPRFWSRGLCGLKLAETTRSKLGEHGDGGLCDPVTSLANHYPRYECGCIHCDIARHREKRPPTQVQADIEPPTQPERSARQRP